MELPGQREIESTLIREVLGWKVADSAPRAEEYPVAWWSPAEDCFHVVRGPGESPCRFSPTRCLNDALEVHEVMEGNGFRASFSRPCFEGAVRLVGDCGSRELVAEGRCLPWALSAILYRALDEGLLRPPGA